MIQYQHNASGALVKEVRRTLLAEWDPIGIKAIPEARDECDSYAPEIAAMLVANASYAEIFDYLWELETGHMGLNGNRTKTEKFAKRLTDMWESIRIGEALPGQCH
jgi:hypothetical protein